MKYCTETCKKILEILPLGDGKEALRSFIDTIFIELPEDGNRYWVPAQKILHDYYGGSDPALRNKIAKIWNYDEAAPIPPPEPKIDKRVQHWMDRADAIAESRKIWVDKAHELEKYKQALVEKVWSLKMLLKETSVALDLYRGSMYGGLIERINKAVADEKDGVGITDDGNNHGADKNEGLPG